MHEFGLCEGVLATVRQHAAGRQVSGIRLRCGIRHAVDQESMSMAFGVVAMGTEAAGATVDVVTVPARISCRGCGQDAETTDLLAVCPHCASADVDITGGDEMTLESLTYASGDGQAPGDGQAQVSRLFERRSGPTQDLAAQAGAVAEACHAMAVRFHQGGKLVVFGAGGPSTDAQHVAVEFVHPVIVGKRALPAISLTADVATVSGIAERDGMAAIFAHQIRYLAGPADIALGISADGRGASVLAGLEEAKTAGLLTIALVGGDGGPIAASPAVDHLLLAASSDPRVVKELHVTLYHVLWELVHVFFEQPGLLDPGVVA